MPFSEVKEIITEDIFKDYVDIQYSGDYNMLTEADVVAEELGIELEDYFLILHNYNDLKEEYGL